MQSGHHFLLSVPPKTNRTIVRPIEKERCSERGERWLERDAHRQTEEPAESCVVWQPPKESVSRRKRYWCGSVALTDDDSQIFMSVRQLNAATTECFVKHWDKSNRYTETPSFNVVQCSTRTRRHTGIDDLCLSPPPPPPPHPRDNDLREKNETISPALFTFNVTLVIKHKNASTEFFRWGFHLPF